MLCIPWGGCLCLSLRVPPLWGNMVSNVVLSLWNSSAVLCNQTLPTMLHCQRCSRCSSWVQLQWIGAGVGWMRLAYVSVSFFPHSNGSCQILAASPLYLHPVTRVSRSMCLMLSEKCFCLYRQCALIPLCFSAWQWQLPDHRCLTSEFCVCLCCWDQQQYVTTIQAGMLTVYLCSSGLQGVHAET